MIIGLNYNRFEFFLNTTCCWRILSELALMVYVKHNQQKQELIQNC